MQGAPFEELLHRGDDKEKQAHSKKDAKDAEQARICDRRDELFFQFVDGYKLHVAVFAASGCEGELVETSEATPIWTDLGKIPYEEMWEDDAYWLPLLLERKKFRGYFMFDGEKLLNHRLNL